MTKGLKQMVEDALDHPDYESAEGTANGAFGEIELDPNRPVEVSGDAQQALAQQMRVWSGWHRSNLILGPIAGTPDGGIGRCDNNDSTFEINVDRLTLNPNRVLLTITPFRLKQEGVLTGAMLHEAAHARFTQWRPRSIEARRAMRHSDGAEVTDQTLALATTLEEPRVEGRMAAYAPKVGADGLEWTMRATAAHVLPYRPTLDTEPAQRTVDFLSTWILQAGRQYALNATIGHEPPGWVHEFTSELKHVLLAHLIEFDSEKPTVDAGLIIRALHLAVVSDDDTGSTLIDLAREILGLLFPETDDDEKQEAGSQAQPAGGCSSEDKPEQGDSDPDDDTSEEEGAGGAGDEEGDEEEQDEAGSGAGDEGDEDTEPEQGESEQAEESEEDREKREEMEEILARMTGESQDEAAEAAEQAVGGDDDGWSDPTKETDEDGGRVSAGGAGPATQFSGRWRAPTSQERETQKRAEHFIRDLISPSESSKETLTDEPSCMVDGAALAAWRASGGERDPRFFRRTRRTIEPSPPVKIAVLVDVSASMSILQEPSSVLSWAISSAALDLRNFAGRGQQIETCLIQWGNVAEVVMRNGQAMPGIRSTFCGQGTTAMADALELVEQEIPGFFDMPADGHPESRLLVQFTDWELNYWRGGTPTPKIKSALMAGVNMLSVVPAQYRENKSSLPEILRACPEQRGTTALIRYDPAMPEQVWDTASAALSARR